jgi:transcriptional regulator with XRE-family HTH domain
MSAEPILLPLDTRLKLARKHRGLSAEEMAELIGVHVNTIRNYERGRSFPNRGVLIVYAGTDNEVADWLIDAWFRDPRHPLQANVTNADNPRYVTRQAA